MSLTLQIFPYSSDLTYNLPPPKTLIHVTYKFIFTYRFVQNTFLIGFYNKLFLSILTSPPPPDQPCNFYMILKCKTTTVCKRFSLVMEGKHFSKNISIFYVLKSKKGVSSHIYDRYLSNEKNTFVDNSSIEPAIFLMKRLSFSLKIFFWPFLWAILH